MNIFGLGLPEIIIIALVLLLFFGPKRLPSLFRSIGTSVRELKEGLGEKDSPAATEKKDDTPVTVATEDGTEQSK